MSILVRGVAHGRRHGILRACATNGSWGVLCLIFVLLISFRVPGQGCYPAPTGITDWWPGDGGANDIVGANNGILEGGASATAAGIVGPCFSFDGTNGYVMIPDSPNFHPTNFTIEAWI